MTSWFYSWVIKLSFFFFARLFSDLSETKNPCVQISIQDSFPYSIQACTPCTVRWVYWWLKMRWTGGWYLHRGCVYLGMEKSTSDYEPYFVHWAGGNVKSWSSFVPKGTWGLAFTSSMCQASISVWWVSHNFYGNLFYLSSHPVRITSHDNSELYIKADSITKAIYTEANWEH